MNFTHTFVLCVPENDWWVISYDAAPQNIELYVDVAMPAEWVSSSHVTTADLDLDVIRLRDGTVFLDDEDEFAEHQISLGYPKDVVAKALETSKWLLDAVAERQEPFGDAGKRYLDMLV